MKTCNYKVALTNIQEEDFLLFMEIINNSPKHVKAYSDLFKKHKLFIYNLIQRWHPLLVSNIEMNTQEIFDTSIVKIQKKILAQKYQLDGRATFRTYIFEVYKYTAKEVDKELQKRKFDLLADYEEDESMFYFVEKSTPYLDAFRYAMQKIENKFHQKILGRIFLEGDAIKSIADNFGIKPSTVRQIKNRKLPFIKKGMMEYDVFLSIK